ncbi:hypothetical protein ENUP19_0216G0010 [Entamoeba nuttalli]|uniref:small monomeric GTPase n=1 Tax=Entamoeba nuttalli TaxID=412467 RepID=A0ABQ0DPB8_9EUKA
MSVPTPEYSYLNIVVVGEPQCGKTSLLFAYIKNEFLDEFTATSYDEQPTLILFKSRQYLVSFVDSSGFNGEVNKPLRKTLYNNADFFIVCYAIDDPISLQKAESVWIPEIYSFKHDASIILVGTKSDLRDNSINHCPLIDHNNLLTKEDGYNVKRKTHCKLVAETSAKTKEGILEVFNGIYELAIFEQKKEKHCIIL